MLFAGHWAAVQHYKYEASEALKRAVQPLGILGLHHGMHQLGQVVGHDLCHRSNSEREQT